MGKSLGARLFIGKQEGWALGSQQFENVWTMRAQPTRAKRAVGMDVAW
jgi:hypothetical protein